LASARTEPLIEYGHHPIRVSGQKSIGVGLMVEPLNDSIQFRDRRRVVTRGDPNCEAACVHGAMLARAM
jgi:hypothetical protein